MDNPIIKLDGAGKGFKLRGNKRILSGLINPDWQYKKAVSNVSFSVNTGESVAFLGPNGAGKTTTTKMMTGLIYPSEGEIDVLGYEPFARDRNFLKNIGLVMGNKAGLNWDLNARQSFELLQKIYQIPLPDFESRVSEMTKLLEVEKVLNTQVRKLSLGERMKLELIGAILHDPKILFLDEPTIGLDIASKKSVRQFLRHLNDKKTIVLTSHDMDDIVEVCKRVVVIVEGTIIYDDSMANLNQSYSHTRYAKLEFADSLPTKKYLMQYGDVVSTDANSISLGADKSKIMNAIGKISKDYPLADITIERVPLELIIQDLFEGKK